MLTRRGLRLQSKWDGFNTTAKKQGFHYNKDYNSSELVMLSQIPVTAIHYNKEVQPTLDIRMDNEGGFVYVRAIFFTVDHTLFVSLR